MMIQRGLYEEADKVLEQVYSMHNQSQGYSELAAIEGTRFMLFHDIKNEERAFYHARRAIQYAKLAQDDRRLMTLYGNMGIIFRDSYPDSSLYYYSLAENMSVERNDRQSLLRNRINKAHIYSDQGEFEVAYELFRELEQESIDLNNQQAILIIQFSLAKLQALSGNYALSDTMLAQVFQEMDDLELIMLKKTSLKEMADLYQEIGQPNRAEGYNAQLEVLQSQINEQEISLKLSQASLLRSIQEIDAEFAALKNEMEVGVFWTRVWISASVLLLFSLIFGVYTHKTRIRRLEREKKEQIDKIKKKVRSKDVVETRKLLVQLMEEEQLYLNKELKVEDLCEIAGVARVALIQAIQDNGWAGFNEYVNHYRVEKMKQLLSDPENHQYSLDYLYTEAGFGSKQSFYKNFRESTSMSPAQWRDTHLSNQSL